MGDAAAGRHAARHRRARHGDHAHAGRHPGRGPDHRRRLHRHSGRAHPVCAVLCALAPAIRRRRSIRKNALLGPSSFWKDWTGKSKISCPWNEAVCRSLITLKALTYAPTGGIVAAPTTSLPECIGGERNWDYRFCWLRDATLTLLALMNAGYLRGGAGLARLAAARRGRQPVADADHVRHCRRAAADRMGGAVACRATRTQRRFASATPPHNQLQLDVYGELMDALHQARRGGLPQSDAGWELAAGAAGASGKDLGRARRTASGRCAAAAALHILQSDGLGRLRPRYQERRGIQA